MTLSLGGGYGLAQQVSVGDGNIRSPSRWSGLAVAGCLLLALQAVAPVLVPCHGAQTASDPTQEQRQQWERRIAELTEAATKAEAIAHFDEARQARRELLEAVIKLRGDKHWQAIDARLALAQVDVLARLSPEQRARLVEANQWQQQAEGLYQKSKYAEAEPLYRKSLAIHQQVLGEEHPDTATSYNRLANNLYREKKYAEAEALHRKALGLRTKALGEEHPDTATSYNNLAYNLTAQGKYAEADSLCRKALAIRQKVLGEEHPDTATSYNRLANNLYREKKYAEAEPLFRRVLALRQKALGEEYPDTASSYNNLADNLNAQGKYAEAEPLYRKALAIWSKVHGEEHPSTATSYNNVADNLNDQGKYAEAEPLCRKALAIRQKVLGEEHPSTATSYNNLAYNLNAQGKYVEADPLYRQALAIFRKVLGEEHPSTATSYNNVAANLTDQGKYAEADPLYRKALAIRQKVHGEEHPNTALSYNNVALNLKAQGKYAEADPLHRKALAIWSKVLGEEHPSTASSYASVAYNLKAQGKYAEADPLYRKALAIWSKVHGEEHPSTAAGYNNVALNLKAQGKYAEADPLLRKALAICQKVLGEEHPNTATSYNNLADNLYFQGKYAEADPLLRKALAICQKVLGEEHPDTAASYNNLALNLNAQGKYAEAEVLAQAAAKTFQTARLHVSFVGLERTVFATDTSPLPLLAALLARRGQTTQAWQRLEEDLARGLLDDLAASQRLPPDERNRILQFLVRLQYLDKRLETLPPVKQPPVSLGVSALGQAAGPPNPWQVGWMAETLIKTEPSRKRQQEADRLRREREATLQELSQFQAKLTDRYGLAQGKVYDLAQIQAQLPGTAALVAWLDRKGTAGTANSAGEHWTCVVRCSGPPIWVKLPGSAPDASWTKEDEELSEQLRKAFNRPPDDAHSGWRQLADRLAEQRLVPLADSLLAQQGLPAVRHLIVLPSSSMAGIPLEALTDRYSVSYAPSATMFAWLQQQGTAEKTPRAIHLLALGNPTFQRPKTSSPALPDHGLLLTQVEPKSNAAQAGLQPGDVLLSYAGTKLTAKADLDAAKQQAAQHRHAEGTRGEPGIAVGVWRSGQTLALNLRPGKLGVTWSDEPAPTALRQQDQRSQWLRNALRGESFSSLPGSQREVEAIAALVASRGGRVEQLLGSDASEKELNRLARSNLLQEFRYVHLATHGKADPRGGLQSYLALAQDKLPDPLTAGEDEVYNGRLTAEQILRTWKLNADLVTLSACETGLGQQQGGEGYLGFAQALFLAGSRSLVLSLWKVDDRATALLMLRFYQNLLGARPDLKQPLPKAAALAEAKRWLRQLSWEEANRLLEQLPGGGRGLEAAVPEPTTEVPQRAQPYEHPYYWAGFILIGDPGDVTQAVPVLAEAAPAPRWPWFLGGGMLGLVVVGLVIRRRRHSARQPVAADKAGIAVASPGTA